MKADNLTLCKRCGSDAAYKQEVNDEITNYSCFGCGFQSNSLMKKEGEFLNEQIDPIPNKKDEYYKHRMDMGTMRTFEEKDYMEALSYIGILPE